MPKMKRTGPVRKPYIRQVRATRPSMRMSNNPGPFVNLPWFKFTYEQETQVGSDNATVRVNVGDVLNQIKTRLQFADNSTIRIKVSNARIWVTAAQGLGIPQVLGSFYNTTNDTPSRYPRASMNDSGTLNMPAKLAFNYPKSDKMVILDGNGQTNPLVTALVRQNQSVCTIRVNVWFQTGTNPGA